MGDDCWTFPDDDDDNDDDNDGKARMTVLQQLIYTPPPGDANEKPFTFLIMVDEEAYDKRRKDGSSIAIANVVDSFEVMRYDNPGKSGKIVKPANRELEEVFGTSDEMTVAEKILDEGTIHHSAKIQNDGPNYHNKGPNSKGP